jgi:hypothetical protein
MDSSDVERLIGTLRRECLDQAVVLNDPKLRRVLRAYLVYYHSARTHLSLDKDAPEPRPVEPDPWQVCHGSRRRVLREISQESQTGG